MKGKLTEHLLSILFVTAVLVAAMAITGGADRRSESLRDTPARELGDLSFVESQNPFHRALLLDVADIYYPGRHDRNAAMTGEALLQKEKQFGRRLQTGHLDERLDGKKWLQLAGMYLRFLLVYIVVMALTYYGVQTAGVWLFVSARRPRRAATPAGKIKSALRHVASFLISMILFSPAYVIAYSMRTELNSDSVFFMMLLGVISNGLLIVYATRFQTFLDAESRKGYVETARAKNLRYSFESGRGGISLREILRPRKRFSALCRDASGALALPRD